MVGYSTVKVDGFVYAVPQDKQLITFIRQTLSLSLALGPSPACLAKHDMRVQQLVQIPVSPWQLGWCLA